MLNALHLMNTVMKYLYMPFLLFLLVSCGNSKTTDELVWDSMTLSGQEYENEIIFSSPRNLELLDDKLILLWPNNSNVIQFINRYDGTSEGFWGQFGNGPGEFLAPYCSKVSEHNHCIYIYDQMMKVLREYSINESFYSKTDSKNETYYENSDIVLGNLHKINSKYSVASIIFGINNSIIALLDENLNIINSFGTLKNQPQQNTILSSYTGIFASSQNKFIYAMRNFGYIAEFEIVSGKIEKKWEHYLDEPIYDDNGNLKIKELKDGFYDVKMTDNYIYCTYSGKIPDKNNYLPETILVFDYSGNPIKRIYTDRQLTTIAVSKDDKMIYATSFNPEISLCYFDISTIVH